MVDMMIGCFVLGLVMFIVIGTCSNSISNLIDDLKNKKYMEHLEKLEHINFNLMTGLLSGCVYLVLLILMVVAYVTGGQL